MSRCARRTTAFERQASAFRSSIGCVETRPERECATNPSGCSASTAQQQLGRAHNARAESVQSINKEQRRARCGFSRQACEILKIHGKPFATYNVLADEELWNHLDEFSGWPTFPQVFVNGKLVGGCDIVTELHESGELKAVLEGAKTA